MFIKGSFNNFSYNLLRQEIVPVFIITIAFLYNFIYFTAKICAHHKCILTKKLR